MLDLLKRELQTLEQHVAKTLAASPASKAFTVSRDFLDRIGRAAGHAHPHIDPRAKAHTQPEKPVPTATVDSVTLINKATARIKAQDQEIADLKAQLGDSAQYDAAATALSALLDADAGSATPPAAATVSVGEASVAVSASAGTVLNFPVTLSAATAADVSFAYALSDGSAVAGTDYTAETGTFTVAAGDTSVQLPVAVAVQPAATATTPPKTLTLTISDPTGATLGTATATGTIAPPAGATA